MKVVGSIYDNLRIFIQSTRLSAIALSQCATAEERTSWVNHIHRMIQVIYYITIVIWFNVYSTTVIVHVQKTHFDHAAMLSFVKSLFVLQSFIMCYE